MAKQARKAEFPAPKHLQKATKAWFDGVVAVFELEEHHIKLLTLAAESWDRCNEAREALAKNGLVYADRFGAPHARPEVSIERDSRTSFTRCLRELALDITHPDAPRPPAAGGR